MVGKGKKNMKIDYEEFNELQTQQRIRDYAQETINMLNCLNQIVLKKYNKKMIEIIKEIRTIENEAVENIKNMIEGD